MGYIGLLADIPLGPAGLNGSKNISSIAPDFLLEALNVSYEEGTISKEGGSAKYNSSAISGTPSIIGGWDWWPDTTTQRSVIVTSAGTILKDSGTATYPTTLASGLTVTDGIATFTEGGKEVAANDRKLFIFTGQNAVQVLAADGATTGSITAPPADWTGANQPIAGAIHEGRLWGVGNLNDPHRAYASLATDHEDFTTTPLSISIFPGEGEKIVGIMSFKDLLIVWKFPTGVYLIDTTDPSTANWRVQRLTQVVGMSGPLCATAIDDDVVYLDRDGNFQLISATAAFGDLQSRNLSAFASMSEFVRSEIALAQLNKTRAVYYPAKREAHFAMAGSGDTTNTRRMVLDFNAPDITRFRFSDKDTCESLWMKKDTTDIQRPASGDDAGFVWDLDKASKDKDGAGYQARFQTAYDDLSRLDPTLAAKRKLGDFIELIFRPVGTTTFNIDVLWDGEITETIVFNTTQTGSVFDTAQWDIDTFTGAARIDSLRKRITGSGRRVSFIGRNGVADNDFSIGRLLLHFRVGDERI